MKKFLRVFNSTHGIEKAKCKKNGFYSIMLMW